MATPHLVYSLPFWGEKSPGSASTIIRRSNGELLCVYASENPLGELGIRIDSSVDNGATWTNSLEYYDAVFLGCERAVIVLDATELAVCLFLVRIGGLGSVYDVHETAVGAWSVPTTIGVWSLGTAPGLRLGPTGIIHCVYSNAASLVYRTNALGVWGPTEVIAGTGGLDDYSLDVDSADVPHLTFSDSSAPRRIMYTNRLGGAWMAVPEMVNQYPANDSASPALILNGSVPLVTYLELAGGVNVLHLRQRTGLGAWSEEETPYPLINSSTQGCGLDQSGNLHLVISDGGGMITPAALCDIKRTPAAVWSIITVVANDGVNVNRNPSLLYHRYPLMGGISHGIPAVSLINYEYIDGVTGAISIYFVTGSTPPTVATLPAIIHSPFSAFLCAGAVTMGSHAPPVQSSFQWGTTPGVYPNETIPVPVFFTTYQHHLGHLTPGRTYYYRAHVSGDGDAYGAEESFTLPYPASGYQSVQTMPATGIRQDRVTLNGCLAEDSEEACQAWFEYGATAEYGMRTNRQGGMHKGDNFSDVTSLLAAGGLFHYRAVAEGSRGTFYGSDMAFGTLSSPHLPSLIGPALARRMGG